MTRSIVWSVVRGWRHHRHSVPCPSLMALITLLSSHRHHCAQLTLFSSEYIRLTLYLSKLTLYLLKIFAPLKTNWVWEWWRARAGTAPTHQQHSLILLIVFTTKTPLSGKLKDKWKYRSTRIKAGAGSCTVYSVQYNHFWIKLLEVLFVKTILAFVFDCPFSSQNIPNFPI